MPNSTRNADAQKDKSVVAGYYENKANHGASSRILFERFADYYDLINLVFSMGSGSWYRRRCLKRAGIRSGMTVIDVAVGTGLLAHQIKALIAPNGRLTGIDLSAAMLRNARKTLHVPLVQASAEQLPFASDTADMVTLGYALRHLDDLPSALDEAFRVLKPGGKIVLIEISVPPDGILRHFHALFVGKILPFASRVLARDKRASALMQYHWETIAAFPPPDTLVKTLSAHRFQHARNETEFGIFHLFVGKKPLGTSSD